MATDSLLATITWRIGVAFLVSCLGQLIAGAYITFNLTLIPFKNILNYTQTEAELVATSVTLGFGMGVPAGMFLDTYGPRLTAMMGLMLSLPGLGFMYVATVAETFFRDKVLLLALIGFFVGQGFFVTEIICFTTVTRQVEARLRGITFGIMKTLLLGGPGLFTLLYDAFFMLGHTSDPENQHVGGFILLLLVFVVIVDILIVMFLEGSRSPPEDVTSKIGECYICTQDDVQTTQPIIDESVFNSSSTSQNYPERLHEDIDSGMGSENVKENVSFMKSFLSKEKYETFLDIEPNMSTGSSCLAVHRSRRQHREQSKTAEGNMPLDPSGVPNESHVPFLTILKSPKFHCINWCVALGQLSDIVVYINIAVITQSINLETYNTTLIVLTRVVICSSTLLSGVCLHYVPHHFIRSILLMSSVGIILVSNILQASSNGSLSVLFLVLALQSFGTGSNCVIGAALLFSFCGAKDYGRNWSVVAMSIMVCSVSIALVLGRMYDSKVTELNTCVGVTCVRDWFYVLTGVTFSSGLCACVLVLIVYKDRSKETDAS